MTTAIWATLALVFARVSALLLTSPVFSIQGVPKHVPLFIAVGVTALIAPGMAVSAPESLLAFTLAFASELLLGGVAGLIVRAVFAAFGLGAELMSHLMGFAIVSQFDPVLKMSQGPIGALGTWIAGLMFLAMGLHLELLMAVARSFHTLPAGQAGLHPDLGPMLVEAVGVMFALGVQLAGPIVVLVMSIYVVVAILMRMAPKMNVFFSISLSINSVAGIVILIPALPWIATAHAGRMADIVDTAALVLGVR